MEELAIYKDYVDLIDKELHSYLSRFTEPTQYYDYYKGIDFQAVSLPYGNKRISMAVFLPDKDSSLAKFQNELTPEHWDEWISSFGRRKGRLALPRFKLEYSAELNDSLSALGMSQAFDHRGASFSAMSRRRLFIDKVTHKTYLDVNEEGTEATGVTSVTVGALHTMGPPPFEMIVDRPFFLAIRDNQTGTILFMGSIVNP